MSAPDCVVLLDLLSNPSTSQEELNLIDRLYWAIWKGRITVADDATFPCLEKSKYPKPSMRKDGALHFGRRDLARDAKATAANAT